MLLSSRMSGTSYKLHIKCGVLSHLGGRWEYDPLVRVRCCSKLTSILEIDRCPACCCHPSSCLSSALKSPDPDISQHLLSLGDRSLARGHLTSRSSCAGPRPGRGVPPWARPAAGFPALPRLHPIRYHTLPTLTDSADPAQHRATEPHVANELTTLKPKRR